MEEVLGFPWSVLTLAESEWSGREVERLRPKEPKGR